MSMKPTWPILVKAEVPGIKKEDIKVAINGNEVTINCERNSEEEGREEPIVCCERYQGRQYRSFTLPQSVDEEKPLPRAVTACLR